MTKLFHTRNLRFKRYEIQHDVWSEAGDRCLL